MDQAAQRAAESRQLAHRLSPNVRIAWNHRVRRMKLKSRIIFDYELLYVEKGELTVRLERETVLAGPGTILLFKPGLEHEFLRSDGECWMPHIHFDALYYEDYEEVPIGFKQRHEYSEREMKWLRPDVLGSVFEFPSVFRIGNHGEVHQALMQLIHAYERRDADYPLIQKSLVLRILHLLQTGLRSGRDGSLGRHRPAMERAASYIAEHYSETIALETLSKQSCLSVHHFSRIFKAVFDVSPHQFHIRCRIEKAKELMAFSPMSLSSIAEQVGYGNVYAFSKAFKRIEGISPSRFANR
ncbi:AraC family transcriptional regulator [Saccharibacillus sp. CPCC 101409]|uniref:AraC family transcriptional regulator n=1 Tax=Saccharibacillus sp. CPCC 101409 TaxID=3058041 RepID=UPI002673C37E|nr:AraC family transcriptional regulator [Saccharibacillus sp. CPCC 101409]MDO3411853.1 AraC family transcriptional regulator [Saccharibacillus sp. CPCC 101409]